MRANLGYLRQREQKVLQETIQALDTFGDRPQDEIRVAGGSETLKHFRSAKNCLLERSGAFLYVPGKCYMDEAHKLRLT